MTTNFNAPPLEIGRVISRTFATLGGNFFKFFLLAVIFGGLPTAAMQYAMLRYVMPWVVANSDGLTFFWFSLAAGFGSTFILLLPTYILIGAITHGALVHLNGGKAGFGECLATGLRLSIPLVAVGFLSTLGITLSMLLFVVPGIMLATRWAVAAPALVAERIGVSDAFGRSTQLALDSRWRIFWLFVVWFVLSIALQYAIRFTMGLSANALATSLGDNQIWVYLGIVVVQTAITTVIASTGAAALYSELRTVKEGATSEELAKVFE